MDQQGKMTSKVALFNGEDYTFWSVRMRSHLMSIGLEVETGYIYSKSVEIGYIYSKSPLKDL